MFPLGGVLPVASLTLFAVSCALKKAPKGLLASKLMCLQSGSRHDTMPTYIQLHLHLLLSKAWRLPKGSGERGCRWGSLLTCCIEVARQALQRSVLYEPVVPSCIPRGVGDCENRLYFSTGLAVHSILMVQAPH